MLMVLIAGVDSRLLTANWALLYLNLLFEVIETLNFDLVSKEVLFLMDLFFFCLWTMTNSLKNPYWIFKFVQRKSKLFKEIKTN